MDESGKRSLDTLIIGGGISGLSRLHALASRGVDVMLLECADRVGGTISSFRTATGCTVELGPNTVQTGSDELEQLIDDIGLRDRMITPDPVARNRYVVRNGRLVPIPMNPKAFLESDLLSVRSKFRAAAEPLIRKRKGDTSEESVASFVRRRFGEEPLDYGVDPFVSGIFAGNTERLAVASAFPLLYELENEGGSVVRGMMRRRKERSRSQQGNEAQPKRMMFSFDRGLAELPKELHKKWNQQIMVSELVLSIERIENGWLVRSTSATEDSAEVRELSARNLVIATEAETASTLLRPVAPTIATALTTIEHAPVAVLSLLYNRADITHPLDGFGMLIPSREGRSILGTIFASSIFPTRAPEGTHLLTTFIGGAHRPELVDREEGEIQEVVTTELRSLLGTTGNPLESTFQVWRPGIPQYNLGYADIIHQIAEGEAKLPGLRLIGSYRNGISVPDCIRNGMDVKG